MAKRFDPNSITIGGRLTKAPELRYTPASKAVLNVTLANNQGEYNGEEVVNWVDAVIWGTQAENIANLTGQGAFLVIEGQLNTRFHEGQDGKRTKYTEVVARRVFIYDYGKKDGENNNQNTQSDNGGAAYNPNTSGTNSGNNFGGNQGNQSNLDAPGGGVVLDISDDDIPF